MGLLPGEVRASRGWFLQEAMRGGFAPVLSPWLICVFPGPVSLHHALCLDFSCL